ncbi:hypothetical protein HpBGD70_10340 [Helicobacter pylori]
MEILVLNLGSSSIKFKLFDMKENKPLASGLAEKIGEEIGQLKIKSHLHHNDQELKEKLVIKDHASGLLMIRENLTKMGIIKDFNQIDAIGHRVVQGGDKFHATMPPVTLTCMRCLMNCMKSIKSAVMVSMGLHTIMWLKKRRSF